VGTKLKFPRRKKEVGIGGVLYGIFIVFYASQEAMLEFSDFGQILKHKSSKDRYTLYVDKRFDFSEVLEYIRNYG